MWWKSLECCPGNIFFYAVSCGGLIFFFLDISSEFVLLIRQVSCGNKELQILPRLNEGCRSKMSPVRVLQGSCLASWFIPAICVLLSQVSWSFAKCYAFSAIYIGCLSCDRNMELVPSAHWVHVSHSINLTSTNPQPFSLLCSRSLDNLSPWSNYSIHHWKVIFLSLSPFCFCIPGHNHMLHENVIIPSWKNTTK